MADGGDEGPEKDAEREEERDEPGEVVLGGEGRKDKSRLQMRHSLTVNALREMGTQLAVCQQRLLQLRHDVPLLPCAKQSQSSDMSGCSW